MRFSCVAAFVSFLLFASTTVVLADNVPSRFPDPDIDISDPTCDLNCPGVGLTFTFSADDTGGGIIRFTNTSGQNWTDLLITTDSTPFFVDPKFIVCRTNAFVSCVAQDLGGGRTGIYLSGVNDLLQGIQNLDAFIINLNDFDSTPDLGSNSGSWGAHRSFNAAANVSTVPEPATLTLLAAGLAVLVRRRSPHA